MGGGGEFRRSREHIQFEFLFGISHWLVPSSQYSNYVEFKFAFFFVSFCDFCWIEEKTTFVDLSCLEKMKSASSHCFAFANNLSPTICRSQLVFPSFSNFFL